ncbi:MAG: T9SS type A sorting domain-containing protein [Flavobacteriales bacterium]
MKIAVLSFTAFLASSISFCQTPAEFQSNDYSMEAPAHHSGRTLRILNQSTNRSTIGQRVNFIDMTANYYSSVPDYDYYFLFPDTSVFAPYSSGLGIPFIHSFGMTFDLSSEVINAGIGGAVDGFDISLNTMIDTIATYGRYSKGSAGHVDTLIYRVVPRGANNLSQVGFFRNQSTRYPSSNDTARYRRLLWDSTAREPFGVLAEFKVPLVLSDTIANGLIYPKAFANGLAVPSIFAITIDFKPGGAYLPTDTLGERIGSYTQVVAEHNGDATFHNYIPGDYTGSGKVHRTVRYNYNGNGWNGRYIPFLAYGATEFEAVDIDLFLRQENSFSTIELEKKSSLFQNYPNPASGITTISYSLENESSALIEMIDITGKKVFTSVQGKRNPGNYSLEINTADLNSGIYFYSLIVNGDRITKKMIVTK